MTLSFAVYDVLLWWVESYQERLNTSVDTSSDLNCTSSDLDGEDVYFRFGGAAICEMLKLRYKEIKEYSNTQGDQWSQEITILKAMTMKDKTRLLIYLKYWDRYFPDPSENYTGHQWSHQSSCKRKLTGRRCGEGTVLIYWMCAFVVQVVHEEVKWIVIYQYTLRRV